VFFSSGVFGSEVQVSEKTVSLRDSPEAGLTKSGFFLFNRFQFRGSAFVASLRNLTEILFTLRDAQKDEDLIIFIDFESNHEPKQAGKHLRRLQDVGGAKTVQLAEGH
jgi:hypothetical protein